MPPVMPSQMAHNSIKLKYYSNGLIKVMMI